MAWSDFFKSSGGHSAYKPDPLMWPNFPLWSAGKDNVQATVRGKLHPQWVVPCGELVMPTGDLVACDPFAAMRAKDNAYIRVPKGKHAVSVTLVDLSPQQDRSHIREAYASIHFRKEDEAYRKAIPLATDDKHRSEPVEDNFQGFFVDAGTACFVDAWSVAHGMPEESLWYEKVFENNEPECWFNRMDDPNHIRAGIANITLPLSKNGENLILFHSGWGDGTYPVVGSFDSRGNLLSAHIDFFVVSPAPDDPELKADVSS